MDNNIVFVLTELTVGENDAVTESAVGETQDLAVAEAHEAASVRNFFYAATA
jgi:hypothetical protein